MKIVICVDKLTGGGAERVASLWARGFADNGHEVHVILSSQSGLDAYTVPSSVLIHNVGIASKSHIVRKILKKTFAKHIIKLHFRKELLQIQPDVVIGVLGRWAYWAKQLYRGTNVKVIQTEHNSFERPNDAPMRKDMIHRKFVESKQMDHMTVLTQVDKNILGPEYLNVSVLPNPLTFEPAKQVPPKENIILATGRFNAWYVKGFDLLLKAWGSIAPNYPKWKLQIAGGGTKTEIMKIRTMATDYGISADQIEFLGFCPDMLPIYQRASIFVLSSRYEGFGMVLTEAMSQGCACIACDFNGRQKEILQESSHGLLCKNNDILALSASIEKMITDNIYRASCQKGAIERSKAYKLENIMILWESIIQKTFNN